MVIYIASDHAGYNLKKKILNYFDDLINLGTESIESVDYPDYSKKLCKNILDNETNSKGILICGTGIGMSISANRFKGIRAALCHCPEFAEMSRRHNNSNVLILPGRFITDECAIECINKFQNTEFEGGRHTKRLDKIDSK